MGFMQRFERKLEGAVGNTFARVFGGKIVPAEVEDALQREAAHGLQHQNGHALAPNHYVVTLSESDEQNLTSDTELTLNAFAKHLTGYIGDQGWETYGAVSVELEASPDLHTGQFRARSVITPDDDKSFGRSHPQPGAMPMSPEPPAPQPRYQPEPPQQQAQAYSQYREPRPPQPEYRQPEYRQPQYQPPGRQEPQHPEAQYGETQYPPTEYPEAQHPEPEYPAAQYSEPEPPVQAYSARPQPGQNFPHQQRYSGDQHADPRFQPPAHLYPPQQQPPVPMAPVPQASAPHYAEPQHPEAQHPEAQYPEPQYPQQPAQRIPRGYEDQAYVGQQFPLRDEQPTAAHFTAADDRYAQPAEPARAPAVYLELGDGSGRTLELRRGSNIVGRGQDAQFRIPDTGVSRQHADIQWDGSVALIVDLQSTNGTVVNDTPINEWQLADGDVIRIGHSDITVRFH